MLISTVGHPETRNWSPTSGKQPGVKSFIGAQRVCASTELRLTASDSSRRRHVDCWGGLVDAELPDTEAWYFGMGDGLQTPIPMRIESDAWTVVDGDVMAVVPGPGTRVPWLAGLGPWARR